jgi:SAM-dependent methyltransferase
MIYDKSMFEGRHETTHESAKTILRLVKSEFPKIDKVLDVGCGVGTFLKAAREIGINTIQGLDGPWVEDRLLQIPKSNFLKVDLNKLPIIEEKYDLVICLEVAEHLYEISAEPLIKFLTSHSRLVLFSAAVPGQGGNNHLNEQWQNYWAEIFSRFGFYPVDLIRPKIWEDPKIPYWYRQNTLIYISGERIKQDGISDALLDIVHPEMYIKNLDNALTIRKAIKLLPRTILSHGITHLKKVFKF